MKPLDERTSPYWTHFVAHTRDRWRSHFGTAPLQLQAMRAQRRSGGISRPVVRHHLVGPHGPLGYIECAPDEPVPAEAHALALQEAPMLVNVLAQRFLLPPEASWDGAFPDLRLLEERYQQAFNMLGKCGLRPYHRQVRCMHTDPSGTPRVLWTFRREIRYITLLNAGQDICTLITLWQQACEAHFQEVLGA
jgi:hypothetical protein